MDTLQQLLDLVKPATETESLWVKTMLSFICEHLSPVVCGSAPCPTPCPSQTGAEGHLSVSDLCVSAVNAILQHVCVSHSLPVSYRLLSVSELVSQQHIACVSNLSWSTNQQRAWAREAELAVPGRTALPRVNLLLIGCLREGRDGEWRLTNSSGSVRCESLSPSPLWLDRPIFLPHWNYIPHDASGQDEAGGFLELIGSPVSLCPGAEQGLAAAPEGGAELNQAVGVRAAVGLLKHRVKGQRLSVLGQVGGVCPLLSVAGTSFFCFTLTDGSRSLPVLVKDSSHLSWAQRVCVGQSVCVTELRVCVLRGWRGNNILCVTERSQLHAVGQGQTEGHKETQGHAEGDAEGHKETQGHTEGHTEGQEYADSESLLLMSQPSGEAEPEEAEPEESRVRRKQSRVISYQGTVTEVVSEGAGLYVLDGKVGLCVAYQPAARRKLRAGDKLELHHIHFLYRPCPDFPPSMLCACLRSTLKVTEFSRVGPAPASSCCPGDGALPRLLLQRNTGVSEYLWACHLSSQLAHSLVPALWRQQCVCLLSWRLMETVKTPGPQGRRDIYSEMLDEPHTCPLTQYSVDSGVHQYLSVSELLQALQTECWTSVCLSSLLPPDGSSMNAAQINSALSWSCRTLSSDPQTGDSLRQRPLLLVGVLELPSQTSEFKPSLQLRDATGAAACVVTEASEKTGGQRALFNTAWIGCLVCVLQFTMVTERFLQSDFPSYQHLDQDRFITHKHCRVYLQFSLDHLHILSPSAAMQTHLRHQGEEPGEGATARKEEEEERSGRKRKRTEEEAEESSHSWPCISIVIRVEQKEGVAWRNTGVESQEAGLRLCFSVRAAVIGSVVSWGRDPKNNPMMDNEKEEQEGKVVLVFLGVCARWFPVLQPGCFYRLIAANTQDPSVLSGSTASERSGVELHADSTLQVRPDWRFHTLTRPLLLSTCSQAVSPTVMAVSEVLDCSSDLVSFQGLVSERISLNHGTSNSRGTHSGVRLTLCDQAGGSLQVYLDLSHTPYPPGLLPGNTLLLCGFQRRLSRTGSVYCTYLPVSSISVTSVGDRSAARPPPAPIMHLGQWVLSSDHRGSVGQVKGHMVCFLFLQLQWSCSLCGSVYTQSCSSSQCRSTSSVFQSTAKLVIDDGTGEAHVWFSGPQVPPLLGLADAQWEGLQRALRLKGHIRVFPRGRSPVCDGDSEDVLLHFLLSVCSSDVVSRPLSLTCRKPTNQRAEEVRRFSRGDRDFLTRLTPPLQLTCLLLHPA